MNLNKNLKLFVKFSYWSSRTSNSIHYNNHTTKYYDHITCLNTCHYMPHKSLLDLYSKNTYHYFSEHHMPDIKTMIKRYLEIYE